MRLQKSILRFTDGTGIFNQRLLKKISDGYGFMASKRFTAVASGSTAEMYFENPSGSGRNIYVILIRCVSEAQGTVDIYTGVSVSSSGTTITPVNLNLGSTNTSIANVEHSGTYDITGATLFQETVAPGGTGVHATGDIAEVGESVIMPPNDTDLLIIYTNESGSAANMSIRIIWWEDKI
jgi:hypothetical protein